MMMVVMMLMLVIMIMQSSPVDDDWMIDSVLCDDDVIKQKINNLTFHMSAQSDNQTLPKAQRTRGLSSSCQSHIASSNTNLDRILSSES